MLKERIKYSEELPVKINILEVENYFLHYHTDIEIIFVLEGTVIFEDGRRPKRLLNAGEIQIINSREMHGFSSNTKNIVMIVQLDCVYFSRYYSYLKNSFFVQGNNIFFTFALLAITIPLHKHNRSLQLIATDKFHIRMSFFNKLFILNPMS